MSKAYFIAQFAELLQGRGILPQLLPGFIGHGIDDEVRMDVGSVTVGGDLYFVAWPCLFRKLLCDLVGLCRGQLLPW